MSITKLFLSRTIFWLALICGARAARQIGPGLAVCMLYARTRDMNVTMQDYRTDCCIRGYHIYRDIWVAVIGEVLECERAYQHKRPLHGSCNKKWYYNWTLTKELFKSLFAFFEERWKHMLRSYWKEAALSRPTTRGSRNTMQVAFQRQSKVGEKP